ncbi:MAG: peptide ABC transporter substrate-binding protein [SAR202 cluster bacterium]|nr:peptide ABC transporter substrate-binding protein [SAR202 cluster bacterium]
MATMTATPTPVSAATSTPVPSPTATPVASPTATPTPTRGATQHPAGAFATFSSDMWGFTMDYPSGWEVIETGDAAPLAVIREPGGFSEISLNVFYQAERFSPADAADVLMPQLLSLPAFRLISEGDVNLAGGAKGRRIEFRMQVGESLAKGVVMLAVRGSQNMLARAILKLDDPAEKQALLVDSMLSLKFQEARPFGIPRNQALTLYQDTGPVTLDPAIAQESTSINYITQIFGGLVSFDKDQKLTPDLAEKYEVSPDGKVFTFTLRSNARFNNGKQVTAGDVKYSWERAADPDTRSPTARTYLGDVIGVKEMLAGQASEISGVKAVNDRTLEVTIDSPKGYFLSKLTHTAAYVVDKDNVAQDSELSPWWAEPAGTGPFRIRAWSPLEAMAMERNPMYHLSPAKVPYVVFRFYGGIPSLMYEDGEIDLALVGGDALSQIQTGPQAKEVQEVEELSVFYIGINVNKAPFDDINVRKAFYIVIDKQKLINEVLQGVELAAHGYMPPGLPGHNQSLPAAAFNPEEARKLLASSKYGGGAGLPDVVFTAPGVTGPDTLTLALLDMWRANLGVRVQVRLVDPNIYYYVIQQNVDHLYNYGWIADYPDPQNFLDVLFHSGEENNVGGYANASVDTLLDKLRTETDNESRLRQYQEVEKMLLNDLAGMPLYFGRSFYLVKPYVLGFTKNAQGMLDLKLVELGRV